MLPPDLEAIVHSYVDKWNYWESLPSIKSIHRIVELSNQSLICSLVHRGFIPPHVVRRGAGFSFAFHLTTYNHEIIENVLQECLNCCCHTGSVFWLFVSSSPSLYHGAYARIFETNSLLYTLINLATMDPTEETTETSFLCLQREHRSGVYAVSLL